MPAGTVGTRPPEAAVPAPNQLLERTDELARLEALIDAAAAGDGGVLVIEGEAGIGKTRLLQAARAAAAERGFAVHAARGVELEREFGHGVVRQLLEEALLTAPEPDRDDLLTGPARPAAAVFGLGDGEAADPPTVQHALFWLAAGLGKRSPLLLCIDDAHWADAPSLRWLVHLAARVAGLPIAVLVGWRPGDPGARDDLREALRREPAARTLEPSALSAEACAELVRETWPAADAAFCATCREVTGGNPFLLGELVGALQAEEIEPTAAASERLRRLGPTAVSRSVLLRLSRLPPAATALARAVAVLDTDAEVRHAAQLAGIDPGDAATAAAALTGARILDGASRLRFAHPILRAAVYEDLAPPERAALHGRAARLLDAEGRADRAAAHLVRTAPAADGWALGRLREAAARAVAQGAPEAARALLDRALEEPPPAAERPAVLRELGTAAGVSGDRRAEALLREALATASAPGDIEQSAVALAGLLVFLARGDDAVEVLESAIDRTPADDETRRMRLEGELATTGINANAHTVRLGERLDRVGPDLPGASGAERRVLAALALRRALARAGSPAEVAELCERAWAGGLLLDDEGEGLGVAVFYVIVSLAVAGQLERSRAVADTTVEAAHRRRGLPAVAGAHLMRAVTAELQGDLTRAERDSRDALHAASLAGVDLARFYALGVLVRVLVLRGELEAAAEELEAHGMAEADPPPLLQTLALLLGRAQLRLALGLPEPALADVALVRERQMRTGSSPGVAARVVIETLLANGRRAEALGLATAWLPDARAFGEPSLVATTMAMHALAEGGPGAVGELEEAAALVHGSSWRTVETEILLDLGGALRRAGRRRDAREPLRRALDLASACGARRLAERARQELLACGARPRREVLTGRDALTPSERRVAELAAEGRTTPEIAQALFVSPKTVETHLRATFRKLDVRSRKDLPEALRDPERGPAPAPEAAPPEPASLGPPADDGVLTTILFTDIVRSTDHAARLGDRRWRELLDRHDAAVRDALARFRGREVKTTGDGFLAAFDSPTRAVHCADAVRRAVRPLGLQVRSGIHVGECSGAGGDLRGLAVHAASRILAAAAPGEVLVSAAVRELVALSGIALDDRGEHELRGLPGPWRLHALPG